MLDGPAALRRRSRVPRSLEDPARPARRLSVATGTVHATTHGPFGVRGVGAVRHQPRRPRQGPRGPHPHVWFLSLIHISEPTRQAEISYAVFCLKKKKT